jgi:hypothetical protein
MASDERRRRERIFRRSAAHFVKTINHGRRPWLHPTAATRLNKDAAPPRYSLKPVSTDSAVIDRRYSSLQQGLLLRVSLQNEILDNLHDARIGPVFLPGVFHDIATCIDQESLGIFEDLI